MSPVILHPTVVVISDLHVGDPNAGPLDDFRHDKELGHLLLDIIPKQVGWPATLVLGGDFIDFPQILPELGRHDAGERFGCTEEQSLRKFERARAGHPDVFVALRSYLHNGGQVLVLPGNHDIDLHWPAVFEAFRHELGGATQPQLRFIREGSIHEQGIYLEHGNQYSFDNWFEHWDHPVLDAPDGKKRIERPWGTLFMDLVYTDIKQLYPFVNQVYPHSRLAQIALRSLANDESVSVKALARLAAFFVNRGKRFAWGRLLGSDAGVRDATSTSEVKAEITRQLQIELADASPERRAAISLETVSLLDAGDEQRKQPRAEERAEEPPSGLLGQNDERGMAQREVELLTSGTATVVSFGHTHNALDGNAEPVFGRRDPRRAFNTGSWMPHMTIGRYENPRWGELQSRSLEHEVRYLVIQLGDPPRAELRRLP